MAIASAQLYGELDGIPGVEPAYAMPVTWVSHEERANALGLGYQVVRLLQCHCHSPVEARARSPAGAVPDTEDVPALLERLAQLAPNSPLRWKRP